MGRWLCDDYAEGRTAACKGRDSECCCASWTRVWYSIETRIQRSVKMAWNVGLQEGTAAFSIAGDQGGRVSVLAGPGTGKSFAIKRRIARLLEEGADPERILAITFTRMAAADLKRDIQSVDAPGAEQVQARTLHAECYRLLARADVIEATGRRPRTLSPFEMDPLLEDLKLSFPNENKKARRKWIQAYEAAWARLQVEDPGAPRARGDISFGEVLGDWLIFHQAMLIGELVPFALQYLRNNPAAPERVMYDHVLVDEYQDLNRAEQEVSELLASSGSIIAVGDDDQSIYSFKYAHPEGIADYVRREGTTSHTMDECYRCPSTVVSMANSLISHNTNRIGAERQLVTREENGAGSVQIFQFPNHAQEIDYLSGLVQGMIRDGVEPGEIIILCQRRKYVKPLSDALRASGILVDFCYSEYLLDEGDAAELMAMLSLAANRRDRVSLRYLCGYKSEKWLSKQWSILRSICEAEAREPYDVLEELCDGVRVAAGVANLVARFTAVRERLRALGGLVGRPLADALFAGCENCPEFRSVSTLLADNLADADAEELAGGLRDLIDRSEGIDDVTSVRVMSLHKSKGLSAGVVIIMGLLNGLFPPRDADVAAAEQRRIEQESRRLLFVGMTRVKARPADGVLGTLILSSSISVPMALALNCKLIGTRVGQSFRTQASPFVAELGELAPAPVVPG